jgi:hypothetical protein
MNVINTEIVFAEFSSFSKTGKPLDACQQKLRDYSLNPPKTGDYEPRCDRSGFDTIQCERSANVCWCVDRDGNERPGTRQKGHKIACPGVGKYVVPAHNVLLYFSLAAIFSYKQCSYHSELFCYLVQLKCVPN